MENWLTGCHWQGISCSDWAEAPGIIFVKNSKWTENHQKSAICPSDLRFARLFKEFLLVFLCKIWPFNTMNSAFNEPRCSELVWFGSIHFFYICLPVGLSVCPLIYPSICWFGCPSVHSKVPPSVGPSAVLGAAKGLSVRPSITPFDLPFYNGVLEHLMPCIRPF